MIETFTNEEVKVINDTTDETNLVEALEDFAKDIYKTCYGFFKDFENGR